MDRVESALERILDGAFGRAFGGKLHPVEAYQAARRALEEGQVVSAEAIYVPNRLAIRLHPEDYAALESIGGQLAAEFEQGLEDECRRHGWSYGARILVRLEPDANGRRGHVEVWRALDERPIPAHLRVEGGAFAGREFALHPGAVLGRSADCDIIVFDQSVSRHHCQFDWVFEGYLVSDLGSTNGTYVNDVQVTEYVLHDHDLLTVGGVRLRFGYDLQAAWPQECAATGG